MQTSLQELIQWCTEKVFNIEGQDGTKYLAIDYEEMCYLLAALQKVERQQIIDAYTTGQKGIIAIVEEETGATFSIPGDDKEDGELYYSETFKK